jgi:quercetin dioxygenase-like cupin family protein
MKAGDRAFGAGRAGMQYRDLVPGRFGGRFIASHIRIETGGPVPDYVHHHEIDFQLIWCLKGWVRVVYEDQGEPMLLEAGDCFLQPPHIRHRVLECSDMMEVVEIASPAEHETLVDHDMRLPTERIDPDRDFGGQRFVFHQASGARWLTSEVPGIEYRNTGVAAATAGLATVVALRSTGDAGGIPLRHSGEFHFVFITRGGATLNGDQVHSGDAIAVPPEIDCTLDAPSDDFECLEVLVRISR